MGLCNTPCGRGVKAASGCVQREFLPARPGPTSLSSVTSAELFLTLVTSYAVVT